MEAALKILSLVEATTVNAVAKNVFEFSYSAQELNEKAPDFPAIDDLIVTFARSNDRSSNEFLTAARELGLQVQVIPERITEKGLRLLNPSSARLGALGALAGLRAQMLVECQDQVHLLPGAVHAAFAKVKDVPVGR